MINWPALILQLIQLIGGAALIATQHDPMYQEVGRGLVLLGVGQALPQGITRKQP